MKQGHTAILICLDETGSMAGVREATISAFNEFINSQKSVFGSAEVWLQRFNTEYRIKGFVPEKFPDLSGVPALSKDNYNPTSLTPLYDAVGHMIDSAGRDFATRPENERPEKVVVVIQTDGEENSSSDYDAMRIREMIDLQTKTYGWQFVFLGANQEAWIQGQTMGVGLKTTLSYDNTLQGTKMAFQTTGTNVANYRTGRVKNLNYDQNDIRSQS